MTGSQTDVDRVMAAFGTTPIPYRPSAPKSFKRAAAESRSAAPAEGSRAARDIAALLAPAPASTAPQGGEPGAGGAMSEVFPLIAFALPEAGDLYVAPANGPKPQAPAPVAPKNSSPSPRRRQASPPPLWRSLLSHSRRHQQRSSAALPARQSFAWPPAPEPPAPEPPAPIVAGARADACGRASRSTPAASATGTARVAKLSASSARHDALRHAAPGLRLSAEPLPATRPRRLAASGGALSLSSATGLWRLFSAAAGASSGRGAAARRVAQPLGCLRGLAARARPSPARRATAMTARPRRMRPAFCR